MYCKFKEGETVKILHTGERGKIVSSGNFPGLGQCYSVDVNGSLTLKEVYKLEKADSVDKPAHYNQDEAIECIDAIRAALGDEFPAYCLGNVMKYTWRYKYKNGIEDLKKAQVYLGWAIDSLDDTDSKD